MITLNRSDPAATHESLASLPKLRREDGRPVFAEPWQAQAFALAVKLSEQGHFTWKEWAATPADELNAAEKRGDPDDGTHYYEHWLAVLEQIVIEKGLTDREAIRERKDAWAEAYLHTPHGKPVELSRADREHELGCAVTSLRKEQLT
jgi:nitrile hydratase accessory protein